MLKRVTPKPVCPAQPSPAHPSYFYFLTWAVNLAPMGSEIPESSPEYSSVIGKVLWSSGPRGMAGSSRAYL